MTLRYLNVASKSCCRIFILVTLISYSSSVNGQTRTDSSTRVVNDFDKIPEIKWEFKSDTSFFASPVVSENLVYIGGLDSLLYAIDINSGIEKWRFYSQGEIRSNVCIGGDTLFLNGGDGMVYALYKRTGKQIWSFMTNGEKKYDFADYFQSTPVLKNGILYFGSGDGHLYAVNSDSGDLVWKFQTGNLVHTTPVIDNNKIFFGSFDGFVYALNLVTGDLVWKFKTVGHRYFPNGEVQGSPAAFNQMIIIGARDYNIYALDQSKGYCHWNKAFTKGWGLCNNIHDSVLYVGSADERVLMAADPATGKELWKNNMEFLVFGNNAYSENMMYTGTTIGKLHSISLKTGEKLWSFETESYRQNRFKYFKDDDTYRDDIYSIIKSNEHFLQVECELGGIFSTPYISDDVIIFSSTNGKLYCLRKAD